MRDSFVCVRITRLNGIDLNRFEFDYDVTWNSFFLDSQLNVYSRYGGRDHGDPEARLSKSSLLKTMKEVLDVHQLALKSDVNGREKFFQPIPKQPFRPHDIPLLRKNHGGCVHCHQVKEYRILQSYHDGKFDRWQLFRFPLPENVGITIDHEHGFLAKSVKFGSAAKDAGVKAGDVIRRINQIPIRSEYDIRWALDKNKTDQIDFELERGGAIVRAKLKPTENWKQTNLGWRKSIRSAPLPFAMRGYPLVRSQRAKMKLPATGLALKVVSVRGEGFSTNLGLKKLDVIIGLNGRHPNRTLNEFKSDLISRYDPGDTVRLTVWRDGKRVQLSGPFPDWFTEEESVP
ncbi:MAG: hypothetical protein CMJ78_25850 [Planctomycetaceae bacterium]|nr:hypothetical protein [Planctomycetaceae bacterium]